MEVIDLDADEEEQQKGNVVEITLDDSKDDGKYSSDKENEIIMVRDSDSDNDGDDDEEGEEEGENRSGDLTKLSGVMQCKHCSRSFRQRRALDTHLRVCQKSPENALRLRKRKAKDKREQIRKQYACKICQEKFDVVVALARHVRVEHSQRKKHRWGTVSQKYGLIFLIRSTLFDRIIFNINRQECFFATNFKLCFTDQNFSKSYIMHLLLAMLTNC